MTIQSQLIDDKILRVAHGDQLLFDYTYHPDTDRHYSPRPFMHPIHTLTGDVVTNSRPTDHPWHNGLSLTLTDVNGMNFWGGGTYRRETGKYLDYPNVGKQVHREWVFSELNEHPNCWTELIDWIGPKNELVFHETRKLSIAELEPKLGFWRLIWESTLTNVLGEKLEINSYYSGQGLKGSGYTGLFMRMSRGYTPTPDHIFLDNKPEWTDYHDGKSIIESGEAINGWKSQRLAHQGVFDSSLNGGLLLCEDLTENPPYELHWFYRPHMPCIAWSTAWLEPLRLDSDATITFKHALGIANGFYTREKANKLWMKF